VNLKEKRWRKCDLNLLLLQPTRIFLKEYEFEKILKDESFSLFLFKKKGDLVTVAPVFPFGKRIDDDESDSSQNLCVIGQQQQPKVPLIFLGLEKKPGPCLF
jgi:hypothetical protein